MYRWLWDIRVSTCSDPLSDVGIGVFPFFRHLALVICCSLLGLLLRPFKAHGTPLAGLGLLPTKGIPLGLLRPAPGRNAAQIALPLPPGGRRPRQRVPRTMPLRPGLMTPFRIAASCPVRQSRSGLLPPPSGRMSLLSVALPRLCRNALGRRYPPLTGRRRFGCRKIFALACCSNHLIMT